MSTSKDQWPGEPHKVEGLPESWDFYDQPGHFVGSESCRFFRHTHVGNGRYCVSTVGEYHPSDQDEAITVGLNRLYETMVFEWQGPNPWDELAMLGYNDAARAHEGHIEVCFAWDRKDDEP